jgi:hypothetical protein
VNVHSATTWPSCRQVTWADPEWYVPRTATDAVPPAVPIWGRGPGALDVLGTRDHTELFHTLGG